MRITDALLGEHGVLYRLFDHLESELDAGADPEPHAALLRAVLHAHATAEDELLFDEMAARVDGDGGPAAAMIREHREVSELLERTRYAAGEELAELLREVMALARGHFRREEEAAFPLAEELFDARRLDELGAAWGDRRAVMLKGSHAARPGGSHAR